jgi:glycosyltransferase involved in cell wall biosynthesis
VPANPTVSVIIPVFNGERFIVDAVSSALSQTHSPMEVIVVDDGSKDETWRILEQLAGKCPALTIHTQPNRGVAHARNAALELATGDFVAFLDADDQWLPEKVELQLKILGEDPTVGVVGCRMRYMNSEGMLLRGASGVGHLTESMLSEVSNGRLVPFPLSSSIFRRSVLEQVGFFDTQLDLIPTGQVEDLDLFSRAAKRSRFASTSQVLGMYRLHGQSASAKKYKAQRMGARYIRARIRGLELGQELDWEEFASSYKLTLRQRHGDFGQLLYRRFGESMGSGRTLRTILWGVSALVASPRYALRRIAGQLSLRPGLEHSRPSATRRAGFDK